MRLYKRLAEAESCRVALFTHRPSTSGKANSWTFAVPWFILRLRVKHRSSTHVTRYARLQAIWTRSGSDSPAFDLWIPKRGATGMPGWWGK